MLNPAPGVQIHAHQKEGKYGNDQDGSHVLTFWRKIRNINGVSVHLRSMRTSISPVSHPAHGPGPLHHHCSAQPLPKIPQGNPDGLLGPLPELFQSREGRPIETAGQWEQIRHPGIAGAFS
jgi:hypothetical protein